MLSSTTPVRLRVEAVREPESVSAEPAGSLPVPATPSPEGAPLFGGGPGLPGSAGSLPTGVTHEITRQSSRSDASRCTRQRAEDVFPADIKPLCPAPSASALQLPPPLPENYRRTPRHISLSRCRPFTQNNISTTIVGLQRRWLYRKVMHSIDSRFHSSRRLFR